MFKTICALLRKKPVEAQLMEVTSLSEKPKLPAFPFKQKPVLKKATTRKPTVKKIVAKVAKKVAKKKTKPKNAG